MRDITYGTRTIANCLMAIDNTDVIQLKSGIIAKRTKRATLLYNPNGTRITKLTVSK